jgi:putative hemolysin
MMTTAQIAVLALAVSGFGAVAAQDRAVELANPAAVYCVEAGGTYAIVQGADGAAGTCTLPSGEVRDAWEYFRENKKP